MAKRITSYDYDEANLDDFDAEYFQGLADKAEVLEATLSNSRRNRLAYEFEQEPVDDFESEPVDDDFEPEL